MIRQQFLLLLRELSVILKLAIRRKEFQLQKSREISSFISHVPKQKKLYFWYLQCITVTSLTTRPKNLKWYYTKTRLNGMVMFYGVLELCGIQCLYSIQSAPNQKKETADFFKEISNIPGYTTQQSIKFCKRHWSQFWKQRCPQKKFLLKLIRSRKLIDFVHEN